MHAHAACYMLNESPLYLLSESSSFRPLLDVYIRMCSGTVLSVGHPHFGAANTLSLKSRLQNNGKYCNKNAQVNASHYTAYVNSFYVSVLLSMD